MFRPAYRTYSPGRILRTHFSKPVCHPGFFQKIYGLIDSLQLQSETTCSGGRLSPSCGALTPSLVGFKDNINGSPLRAGYTGCLGSLITQPIKPPSLERNGWQFKVCLSRLCISTFTHYCNLTVEELPTTARGRCQHDFRNSRFSHFL